MDKKHRATIPNREELVVSSELVSGEDMLFPTLVACNKSPKDVNENDWFAVISTKTGMDKTVTSRFAYETKLEAEEQIKAHPIGRKIELSDTFSALFDNGYYAELLSKCDDGSDEFHHECYRALVDCGVKTEAYTTAKIVLDDASSELIAAYKSKYGENWTLALETKYVLSRYHITSLAGYAVRIFYCYYILENDHSVGYLWREMEMVLSQSEEIALKELERKKASGEMAAKASRGNKARRIESMLSAMEAIVSENPAFTSKTTRQALVELALENAEESDPSLWSQGKGQKDNYLSAMKTDEPFKERFEAMGLK